jgi:hypothetical protein
MKKYFVLAAALAALLLAGCENPNNNGGNNNKEPGGLAAPAWLSAEASLDTDLGEGDDGIPDGSHIIRVSWAAVPGATAYEVWYGISNNPASSSRFGGDFTETTAVITGGLVKSRGYFVWAKAKNQGGESGFSPRASCTTSHELADAFLAPGKYVADYGDFYQFAGNSTAYRYEMDQFVIAGEIVYIDYWGELSIHEKTGHSGVIIFKYDSANTSGTLVTTGKPCAAAFFFGYNNAGEGVMGNASNHPELPLNDNAVDTVTEALSIFTLNNLQNNIHFSSTVMENYDLEEPE